MNERKKLIEQLRLDYTASNMALALMKQAADMLEADVNWEQVPKPPLPRAGIKAIGVDEKPLTVYITAQMHEYGELCIKQALITGPGYRMDTPPLTMEVLRIDAGSAQPHNALADARGIRDALAVAA